MGELYEMKRDRILLQCPLHDTLGLGKIKKVGISEYLYIQEFQNFRLFSALGISAIIVDKVGSPKEQAKIQNHLTVGCLWQNTRAKLIV